MSYSELSVMDVASVSMEDIKCLSTDGNPFWIRHFFVLTKDGGQVRLSLFAKSPEALDLVKV